MPQGDLRIHSRDSPNGSWGGQRDARDAWGSNRNDDDNDDDDDDDDVDNILYPEGRNILRNGQVIKLLWLARKGWTLNPGKAAR